VRLEAAYLYVDSQLDDENRWMPQVPRHQGSAQLLYSSGATLVSAGIRPSALQFEDDLNQFVLPGFTTFQLMLQRRLGNGVSAIFAAENLFNRTFLAGFDPQPTTGTPRLMRVGLKWETGR
jgi:outer membrane receptor protein involved in Fe transport